MTHNDHHFHLSQRVHVALCRQGHYSDVRFSDPAEDCGHHKLGQSTRHDLLKSYLGSMGNIMENYGLLELIQLIYPGSTTASHILDRASFDKAIHAHLLIDAAIYSTSTS